MTEHPILLADSADGKPLTERDGPLKIVAPGDKKHPRWVRGVVALVVRSSAEDVPAAK